MLSSAHQNALLTNPPIRMATSTGLIEKIAAALPDSISIDPAFVGEQFSFHGMPAREMSEKVWTAVVRALQSCRVLRIVYSPVGAEDEETRDVEPVHVACIADEWYLVAHCRTRDALRHFSIARIRSAKPTAETFEPPDFGPEEYFSNRFGRFIGKPGKTYNVVVKFTKTAAPWVLERTWHPKQEVRRHRDGSLTLSFPAPALYEVKRWILSWGAEAEVLAPKELWRDIANEATALTTVSRLATPKRRR